MIYESELYHHGIKGQKWGKQNGPPYPLSRQQEKKISRQYHRYAVKANRAVDKQSRKIDKEASEAATKKVGSSGSQDAWNKEYSKLCNQSYSKIYNNNESFKKAQELCDKYNMTSWDTLAQQNSRQLAALKKYS